MFLIECYRLGSKKKKNITDMTSGAKIDAIIFDTPEFQRMSAIFTKVHKEGGISDESLFRLSVIGRDLEIESLFWRETAEQRQSTAESYLRVLDFLRQLPEEYYGVKEDTDNMPIVFFWERLLWTGKEIELPDDVKASFKLDDERFLRYREIRQISELPHYNHSAEKNPYFSSVIYRWFVFVLKVILGISFLTNLIGRIGLFPQGLTDLPFPISSAEVVAATSIVLSVDYFLFSDVREIEDEMQIDAVMQRTITVCSQMKKADTWIPFIEGSSESKAEPIEESHGEKGDGDGGDGVLDGLRLRSGFPLK